jgi:hypothetical protein
MTLNDAVPEEVTRMEAKGFLAAMKDITRPTGGWPQPEPEAPADPRAGEKVCIGVPHLNEAGWNFTESVLRMVAYDKQHGDHLMHNSGLMNSGALAAVWGRSMELSHARNTATAAFLASDADWLLWIDTDIGFEPNALEELLKVADPDTAPIVGGLAFIEGDFSHDFRGGLRSSLAPTLYDWSWVEPKNGMPGSYKMVARTSWNGEPTRVAATGCGFLLTHRSAYEKIAKWARDGGAPAEIWFERIPGPDGEKCGEDISFCLRAHQVGLPVMVHTGVTTTHQKTAWYGTDDYKMKPFTPPASNIVPLAPAQWPLLQINPNAATQAAQDSPIRNKQVPEATEEVAIIVPVAQRDNAETFLTSLVASLTPRQRDWVAVYVMADDGDILTVEAWARETVPDLAVMIDEHRYLREMGSFAEKVNRGHQISVEPWLFLVGDDVKFHPGWLDQAMEVARLSGAAVVGTNDLGNPAVLAGTHATHMLIRRAYVNDTGASWDGPGVVCHEGYRHWYVDNEIIEAAKARGEWAPCLAAHVEHLHPYFGKGEMDPVYALGQAAAETDGALFRDRWSAAHKIENEG